MISQWSQRFLTRTEDLAERAALFPGNSSNAEEELSAVQRVGVFSEGSLRCPLGTHELLVFVDKDGVAGAVRDLADPQAAMAHLVIGQSGGTLVPESISLKYLKIFQ